MATTRITLSGDFFRGDPKKKFDDNVLDMLTKLAAWAEQEVKSAIASRAGRMPFYTGHSRESVRGRVESISGKDWHRHLVVSANTAGMGREEAIATKAAAASIERRWHMFRRVSSAVRRAKPVLQANLTKGME